MKRWDCLIVENSSFASLFSRAFLFSISKIMVTRYPRAAYLCENKSNTLLINEICVKYGLDETTTKVLYLPTWRDYNYQRRESDINRSYLLDCESLQSTIGPEFDVLFKDHAYLHRDSELPQLPIDAETQELLLISDYVITDYSSVVFDALAIDKRVIVYASDFETFQKSRGVYSDVWSCFEPLAVNTVDDVASEILNYTMAEPLDALKKHYNDNTTLNKGVENYIIDAVERNLCTPKLLFITSNTLREEDAITILENRPIGIVTSPIAFVIMRTQRRR